MKCLESRRAATSRVRDSTYLTLRSLGQRIDHEPEVVNNEEGFLEVLDVDGLGHHDLADWYTARWGLLGDKPEKFSLFNTS